MKNIKKLILAAALSALAISMAACVPQERNTVRRDPDLSPKTGVELDFVQVHNDTLEAFPEADENPYSYITDVTIDGSNDPKVVIIEATCVDEATEDDAKQFAAAVVRRASDAISVQSGEYSLSNQESFGDCWDAFELKLTIKKEGAAEGDYLLNLDIPAGEEIPLDPDVEKYEEDWAEQRARILENTVY